MLLLPVLSSLFSLLFTTVEAKCIFGHEKGQEYVVEQTYHSSDQLKFVYTCQSRKFDDDSPEFFFYQLESCTADDVTYTPGEQWRNGAFKYECFFRVSKDEGSISEVRHVGCFVQDYLIEKDKEALIGLSLEERSREEECVLSGRVAVAYLVDTSESVKEADFDTLVRPAVAKELGSLPDTFLIRLAAYSTQWGVHSDWLQVGSTGRPRLAELVSTLPYFGEGTRTARALLNTSYLFDGIDAEAKFIVLLTDGEARDKADIPSVVKELNRKAIKVVSVGIGTEIKADELEEYGYSVVELTGLQDLEKALAQGIIRCKIFERLVKVRDAKRECERWAEQDVPMEGKFMPPCPISLSLAKADDSLSKDPACTDIYDPAPSGPGWRNCHHNRGAHVCYFTKFVGIRYGGKEGTVYRSRSQCCYNRLGQLLRRPQDGAGSADKATQLYLHVKEDLRPAEYCSESGLGEVYGVHRPPGVDDPSAFSQKTQ